DQNGQVMAGASVAWASSDASVATVDAAGVATATANGSATITATSGSVSGTAAVTVAQVLNAVAVSPASDTLVAFGDTVRLVAEATDANGHAVAAATEFEWSSSDTLVARVDDSGLVESLAEGEAVVTATASEVTGVAELTVVPPLPTTVAVSPDTVWFTALGQTTQLVAEVREQAGRAMAEVMVSWSSGDTLIAVVDSAGLVTAVGGGTTTVTAAAGEVSGDVVVSVMQSAGSVVVSPREGTIGVGDTLRLAAEAFDENGHAVDGAVFSWSSSDAGVARVDESGLVEAVAEGTARVRATAGDASGVAEITVEHPDRAALVALYEATDGPNWVANENWLTDAPLGEWYGVETDVTGRVVGLDLSGGWDDETLAEIPHGLTGQIPPELGNLDNLQELNLSWNNLTGPIPPELGQLGNLRHLYLLENRLSGHIPPELGSLRELLRLSLGGNLLTRTIPRELGDLAKLKSLNLNVNRLEGTIPPELGNLTELTRLRLDQNELEGQIPSQLGGLTKLSGMNLGWNNLTGPIPPELGNLANLVGLNLDNNELTGPIPSELGSLTKLFGLALANNDLTGRIPPWVVDRKSLAQLRLGGNALTGPIPPGLGSLTQLTSLYLAGNQLTGPIPPELGNLHQLERLSLGSNRLTGSVPPELGHLRRLVSLTLSGNLLTGSIPETFVELNNLVTLGCRRTEGVCLPATVAFRDWARQVEARGGIQNAIDIPWCDEIDAYALRRLYQATNGDRWTGSDGWLENEDLGRWRGVRTDSDGRVTGLDLSGNGLSGHLPDAMGLLANLTELKVGDNALSGRMPLSLADLPLQEFDYSETSLCVADDAGFRQWLNGIPRHVGTAALCPPLSQREALEWLFRRTDGSGWNESTGWLSDVPLENWHGVQTNASGQVVALSLRGNGLSGPIPPEIAELPAVTHVDLGSNRLEGRIPDEIGRLSELRVLDLIDNALAGPIPPEIGGLSKLTTLNLGGNRLSDAIPVEIGRLSELRRLELGANNLSGPIPSEVGDLSRLERLSLGWNQLSGEIPGELARLSSLRRLDLGDNVLSGSIPSELGTLSELVEIRLGRNRLNGAIPEEIGRLANLVRLDLADNDLSGPVPAELGALSHLEGFLLQSNQLSGEIPEEIGRLAKLVRLDLADNQLSGPIPSALGDLTNLVELNLGDNRLTGRLLADLGRATKLENLDLRSNALSGPVPSELADLTLLKFLILADNPDLAGPLPQGIKALEQLERFMAGGTGLCRPADSGFDAWFAGIPERRLLRCAGGAAVYLTQAVQSWDDPVPLLAGKPALLRVFVTAPPEAAVTMPEVRATFHVNGTERHTILIAARMQPIPSEVREGDLEVSVNAEVPDWLIVPGLEMVIEVDPDQTLDPALGVTKRIPEEGRIAVDVRAVPPLHLTLVPLLPESDPDSSIVASVLAMAEDPDGHELLDDVRTLLPITEFTVTAHEPVATSFRDPFRLIRETEAMRLMEGGSGYWMGIIQPPPRTGGSDWYYLLPIGVAYAGGQASVSIREASVIAHDLGHNLSLLHAPCGGPRGVDPWFPYPIGNTGAWGYDFAEKALVGPDTPDLMSYCGPPDWISDFFFNKALNHRLAEDGATAAAMADEANPERTLLLWGGRDEDGLPYLDPAFVVDAAPSLPVAGGDYTIDGATVDGTPVFSLAFDMPVIADAEGEESSFVFALPVQSGWEDSLASITLSGPGGLAVLDETTNEPIAIFRDPRTGQVRGFLQDPALAGTQVAADAMEGAVGQAMEVLFSRGIPGREAWRR
ncbi:MAG: hypothetical protein F4Z44_15330, partial [Gemmatimonadetes bacterium]|nr:hypothetical protein [Gemmatimonadota bacterium]